MPTAREKKFLAEDDALTLAEAESIKANPRRLGDALKAAVELEVKSMEAAKVLNRIVKKKDKGKKNG